MDNEETAIRNKKSTDESRSKFPWEILLALLAVALIAAIIFFASKNRKSSTGKTVRETSKPDIKPMIAASAAPSHTIVNLEEEIRCRAYELYLQRNGQNEDVDKDWYKAVSDICARYEAAGYQTYTADGSWWARS
jgi:hypothetical protein